MYAIAKSGGKQFKIEQNSSVRVPTLKAAVGDKVRLDSILLLSRGDNSVAVGAPFVEGAYAEARVIRQGRGPKLRIIKYKRRKNYRRTIGHRQGFTELMIDTIVESGAAPAETVEEQPQAAAETDEPGEAKPRRSRKKSADAAEGETPAAAAEE